MGEEWRRDWHPESIPPLAAPGQVLVIGGGPAGLEAARALGQRGAEVTIAEKSQAWGGRAASEARLPGLASWGRVRDWRLGQLQPMTNVSMYLASAMTAEDVLQAGAPHVVLATGSRWRADAVGRSHRLPVAGIDAGPVLTPDHFLDGGTVDSLASGPAVVFDDDGYYMGALVAELLARAGHETIYVTPHAEVSRWTQHTMEQTRIQARLIELGVTIHAHRTLAGRTSDGLELACIFTGRRESVACATLIPVTSRLPVEDLWLALNDRRAEWADAGIRSVTRIGDCLGPGTIAAAVHSGHRYAREFGETIDPDVAPFRRERIV
jgi:dimethylamine/trimethylamine dehydrogenase